MHAEWEDLFALFHEVWGDAAAGRYTKRTWGQLGEQLAQRARAAGYVPRAVEPARCSVDEFPTKRRGRV
jgi:hypothetical protein